MDAHLVCLFLQIGIATTTTTDWMLVARQASFIVHGLSVPRSLRLHHFRRLGPRVMCESFMERRCRPLQDIRNKLFDKTAKTTFLHHETDPSSDAFMCIGSLDKEDTLLKHDGKYRFKLIYDKGLAKEKIIIFSQSSWPLDTTTVSGYYCVEPPIGSPGGCKPWTQKSQMKRLLGLAKCGSADAVLDGNGHAQGWWNAVGAVKKYKGTIPGWHGARSQTMELYIATKPVYGTVAGCCRTTDGSTEGIFTKHTLSGDSGTWKSKCQDLCNGNATCVGYELYEKTCEIHFETITQTSGTSPCFCSKRMAMCPTVAPTFWTTSAAISAPSLAPSHAPTFAPSHAPTVDPNQAPSLAPLSGPSPLPTFAPSLEPTPAAWEPTDTPEPTSPGPDPTLASTSEPTPAETPTAAQARASTVPTNVPTQSPSGSPALSPTTPPTSLTMRPTVSPTPPPANIQSMLATSRLAIENVAATITNGTVTENFAGGVLTARRLDVANVSSSEPFQLSLGEGESEHAVAVELPLELVQALQNSVVVMAVLNGTEKGALSADGSKMASTPVSIDILAQGGESFKGPFPAKLVIKVAAPETSDNESVCAYWDEKELRWLSRGMKTSRTGDAVLCETDHLTLFALVIFEEFVKALSCSNSGVLAPARMVRIFEGTWHTRAPAIILHISFLVYVTTLLMAWRFDIIKRRRAEFKSEFLLVEGEEDRVSWLKEIRKDVLQTLILDTIGVVKNADKLKVVVAANDAEAEGEDAAEEDGGSPLPGEADEQRSSPVERVVSSRASSSCCGCCHRYVESFVRFASVSLLSALTAIEKEDLKHHSHLSRNITTNSIAKSRTTRQQISPYVLKHGLSGHADTFGQSLAKRNALADFWTLAVSQLPMVAAFRYSVFISSSMRAALLGASILGPACIAAFFFSTTGEALSLDSPDACSLDTGSGRYYVRNIIIGAFSWLATTLPVLLLTYLVKKKFVYRKSWDHSSKRHVLRRWRCRDLSVYWVLVAYSVFCEIFCLSFLANVNPNDEYKWLISVGTVLVEDFLVGPLIISFVLWSVFNLVRWLKPDTLAKALHDIRISETSPFTSCSVLELAGVPPSILCKRSKLRQKISSMIENAVTQHFQNLNVLDEHVVVWLFSKAGHESCTFAKLVLFLSEEVVKEVQVTLQRDELLWQDMRVKLTSVVANVPGIDSASVDVRQDSSTLTVATQPAPGVEECLKVPEPPLEAESDLQGPEVELELTLDSADAILQELPAFFAAGDADSQIVQVRSLPKSPMLPSRSDEILPTSESLPLADAKKADGCTALRLCRLRA